MNKVFVPQRWDGEIEDEALKIKTDKAEFDLVNYRGVPILTPGHQYILGYIYTLDRATFRRLKRGHSGGIYNGLWSPISVGGDGAVLAPVWMNPHMRNDVGVVHLREINAKVWHTEVEVLRNLGEFQNDDERH